MKKRRRCNYNLVIYLLLIILYIFIFISTGLYISNGAIVGLGLCAREPRLSEDCCGADQCQWATERFYGCGIDLSDHVLLGSILPQVAIVLFAFYCLLTTVGLVYFFITMRHMRIPYRRCVKTSYVFVNSSAMLGDTNRDIVPDFLLSKLTLFQEQIVLRFIWPLSLLLNSISIVTYYFQNKGFHSLETPFNAAFKIGNVCNNGSHCPPYMKDALAIGDCNSRAMVILACISLATQSIIGVLFYILYVLNVGFGLKMYCHLVLT
jgi:hypothetical protein